MYNDNDYTTEESCSMSRFGTSMLLFAVGGIVGATIALLFAPKRGSELRADIADTATKSRERVLEEAHAAYDQAGEYYGEAKEKATDFYHEVAGAVGDLKKTFTTPSQPEPYVK